MSATEKTFNTIGSVPTHYARQPVAAYGTIGRQHNFRCTNAFYLKLEACFSELWRVYPHGQAQAIVSAGAYVNKPGYHGMGRAFDLDAIFWPGKSFITNRFEEYPSFYLGVEAVLRKHFGTVLDYNYNRAHRDHFHIDDGGSVGFHTTRSHTLFMQGVCYYMLEMRFDGNVDGDYGSATRTALEEACAELGVPTPLSALTNWNQFLDAVARLGLRGERRTSGSSRPADYDCVRHR
ncbi:MAG: hypothetical protein P9F19_12325 [Candidatus Contendobacter sp.]|nr:hypothetical protein [Candidatus Contendobacter sp.]MDG4558155.1 hypothetical protein [Candidatus Contendobacter sp.]